MASNTGEIIAASLTKLLYEDAPELCAIWNDVGYDAEYRKKYLDQFTDDVIKVFDDAVSNESERWEVLKNEIAELNYEISALKSGLERRFMSPVEPNVESFSILELKAYLEKEKILLLKEKDERIEQYESLKVREERVSKKLGITAKFISFTLTPTFSQLTNYEMEINSLDVELAKRERILKDARQTIRLMMNELNYIFKTDFEKDVVAGENFVFSDANMHGIELLKIDLVQQVEERNSEANELRGKVVSLWHFLKINEEMKKLFLENCSGHYVKYNIAMLKKEFDRCHELKLKNLQKYTEDIRAEIREYWKMMFMECTHEQRSFFENGSFTEDLFDTHQQELESLKKRYEDAEEIFQSVGDRMNLWERKKTLERKQCDPARFTNRGGNLLPELNELKVVETRLRKLDGKILSDVAIWMQRKGEIFLVGKRQIEDFFQNERDIWEQEKVNLRSEMRARMELNKTAVCNFKRRREMTGSPLIARSKMAKVDESGKGGGLPKPTRRRFPSLKKTKIPRQPTYAGNKDNPFSIVCRF